MVVTIARWTAGAMIVAAAACGPAEPPDDGMATEGDTIPAVQPVSPAEIERQAEPMTPEEAEERGVVDTTIHVTDEP